MKKSIWKILVPVAIVVIIVAFLVAYLAQAPGVDMLESGVNEDVFNEEVFNIFNLTHAELTEKYGEVTQMEFWLGAPYAYYNNGVLCYYETDDAEILWEPELIGVESGGEYVYTPTITEINQQAKPNRNISVNPQLLIKKEKVTLNILDEWLDATTNVEYYENEHDGTSGYEKMYTYKSYKIRVEATVDDEAIRLDISKI